MSQAEEDEIEALRLLARGANGADARPRGEGHLGDDVLARVRAADENAAHDDAVDAALRHLAACASCRARLLERDLAPGECVALAVAVDARDEAATAAALEGAGISVTRRGPGRFVVIAGAADAPKIKASILRATPLVRVAASPPMLIVVPQATAALETAAWGAMDRARGAVVPIGRRGAMFGLLAAAAVMLLVVGGFFALRAREEPLAVTQRAYTATLGEGDAGRAVDPADENVELSLRGAESAALVVCDERGAPLGKTRWFASQGERYLQLVVAPRRLATHEGRTIGFVVAGSPAAVKGALPEVEALLGKGASADALEAPIRAAARDARVQKIVIGAP